MSDENLVSATARLVQRLVTHLWSERVYLECVSFSLPKLW